MKFGNHSVILFFLLLIACLVPATNAATGEQTMITSQHPDIREPPILIFDNISDIRNGDKNSYPQVAGVTEYDVISIDAKKLKQRLMSREKIPIHLDGIPYVIIPYTPDLNRGNSFVGRLENSSGSVVKNCIVQLTIDYTGVHGVIHDSVTDSHYYINDLGSKQSDENICMVYSSRPGHIQGFNTGEDSIVVVQSGESKTFSQLTPEDIEWLISQQMKNENQSGVYSYPTTAQPAPLPVTIAIASFGIYAGVAGYIHRK
ncbi:hypothetical protein [Methanoregula sp.]|uniref:hypothetical protein n=1 Tax=Methanoregula sp. TaxID=2052170 RepID=UPI00356286C5